MTETTGSDGFDRLLAHIEDNLAFESSHYNDAYLDRRISARMRRRGADTYGEYLDLLRADDDEPEALLDSLSINVTGFFRNPEVWTEIRDLLRELTASGRTRVWSAPCSDGREPYSLAMLALDDDEIRTRRLEIVGSDINEDVLDRARNGVYQTTRTTDIEAELEPLSDASAYVDREEDSFEVVQSVKDLVTFRQHDLIRDDPETGMDLVLCRNLLIYINSASKRSVVETVVSSLEAGGYLVVGMTETLPRECKSSVTPVNKRRRVYRKVD
ncbi:MAG: protein-glutamate O-methyltransferase CheR [Haloferacaceae archaeon]